MQVNCSLNPELFSGKIDGQTLSQTLRTQIMKDQIGAIVLDGNVHPHDAWKHLHEPTRHLMNAHAFQFYLPAEQNAGVEVWMVKSSKPCRIGMVGGAEFFATLNDGNKEVTTRYFVPLPPADNTRTCGWWINFKDPILQVFPEFTNQQN